MGTQHITSQKLTSIVGAGVAALALIVLFVKLDEHMGHFSKILGAAGWLALELVPHFVVAAAHSFAASGFNHVWVSSCPLQMLASFSPLHILLGAA